MNKNSILCLALTTLLSACYESQTQSINSSTEDKILATVDDQTITQSQIDVDVALELYDLEWAKYEVRKVALARALENKVQATKVSTNQVNVLIEPPMPPRLALERSHQPRTGKNDAPIKIAIFCSYESSHCARMTSVYEELNERYPEALEFTYFDFPQAYHRNGKTASIAAHCADGAGKFIPYHKGLMANFDQLGENLYMSMARQVNADVEQFAECYNDASNMEKVMESINQATAMGLKKVPVTLVNGLYLNGPKSIDILSYFVDKELARLGVTPAQLAQQKPKIKDLAETSLPLRLESTLINKTETLSSASILHTSEHLSKIYYLDEEIMQGVTLKSIHEKFAVISNNGRLERLSLIAAPSITVALSSNLYDEEYQNVSATTHERNAQAPSLYEEPPSDLEYSFRGVVEAVGETPLSRDWLNEQLQNKEKLLSHFEAAELEVEGSHVMRLRNISEDDFYQTLGLKENDVILRVNNEWIHDGQNNLMAMLEQENTVSIVLMRRGLPVHLKYQIN